VRSILELRFLRLCAAHDIPRPRVNEKIGPWTVDFYWPDHDLVVETDGVAFHRTPAKRDRDKRKDAYLEAHSLSVLRLSWSDVTERPEATAHRVRTKL
jgi:very-short-patch-repair endonuclease